MREYTITTLLNRSPDSPATAAYAQCMYVCMYVHCSKVMLCLGVYNHRWFCAKTLAVTCEIWYRPTNGDGDEACTCIYMHVCVCIVCFLDVQSSTPLPPETD